MTTESVRSTIHIDATPERVRDVLSDLAGYPQWARSVKEVTIDSTDDEGRPSVATFTVSPGPLPTIHYTIRYTWTPDRISWEYVSGDLGDLHGSYTLASAPDGVEVTYELAIDPGMIPMPGFLKARAAREITKIALNELKRHVEGG